MRPQKLALTPFTEGDEWEGIPQITITVGPEGGPFGPPPNPLQAVTMRFKKSGSVPSDIVELSSAVPAEIEITDAVNWTFTIKPQITALQHGKWTWRIKCTDDSATGKPKTFLADEIEILETV